MSRLVSVLIPAFNAERFIGATVESALAQTWAQKEIIIVDDGSKDDTLAIARRFESKDVLVVSKSNEGAAATRNRAFALCQGDYIQWLDADDLLGRDKISGQMSLVERGCGTRTLLSSGWAYFMYRPERARFRPTPLWCDLSATEWLMRKMGLNLFMQTATWLVSRELTDAAGPWNTRLLGDDDGEYFCRVLLASDGVRFARDSQVFYRVSGAAGLHYIGTSDRKMDAHFASMRLHVSHLLGLEDSERSRAVCVTYLQNWLPIFYPERPDIVHQAEQLASELGGHLTPPRLSWKYDWIRRLLGWSAAKKTQRYLRQLKASRLQAWDRVLFQLESRTSS